MKFKDVYRGQNAYYILLVIINDNKIYIFFFIKN